MLSKEFDIAPFEIKVQKIERIFIDKLFAAELYFEETDIEGFVHKLENYFPEVQYVNRLMTHSRGQKVVRFYDPDGNLIEVGTPMWWILVNDIHGYLVKSQPAAEGLFVRKGIGAPYGKHHLARHHDSLQPSFHRYRDICHQAWKTYVVLVGVCCERNWNYGCESL